MTIEAANDIEFAFSDAKRALRWAQGYEETTRGIPGRSGPHYYYSYASCDDCYPPRDPNDPERCAGEFCWQMDEIVGANWANRAALPFPQIYYPWPPIPTDQSAQWQWVNSYAATHYICLTDYGIPSGVDGPMYFKGVMASPGDLSPDTAWQNLWKALKGSGCTTDTAQYLLYVTSIIYYP